MGGGAMTSADEAYQMLEAVGNGDAEFWRTYGVVDPQTDVATSPVFLLSVFMRVLLDELFPQQPSVEAVDRFVTAAAERAPRAAAVLTADYARASILACFDAEQARLVQREGSMERVSAVIILLSTAAGLSEERIRLGLNDLEEMLSDSQSPDHPHHEAVMELRLTAESIARQTQSHDPSTI